MKSTFVATYYRALWYWNFLVIQYEKYVLNPLSRSYKQIYNGAITEVTMIDIDILDKFTVYKPSWWTHFIFMWYWWFNKEELDKRKMKRFIPRYTGNNIIYEIKCFDDKRYLVRGSFDISKRVISPFRHKYIHVTINDKKNITSFVNKNVESFTKEAEIDSFTLLSICFIKEIVSTSEFVMLLNSGSIYIKVINDETFEERVFKDKECLQM